MNKVTWEEAEAASRRRDGSAHEEWTTGGNSICGVCGEIEEADINNPLVREYHADSFLEGEEALKGWEWDDEKAEWRGKTN